MDCSDITLELPGLLYDELDAEARAAVESHLASCSKCKAEYETLQRTAAKLDQWSGPKKAAVASTFFASVGSGGAKGSRVFRLVPLLGGAVAAMVVFGSLVLLEANVSYQSGGFSVSFGPAAAMSTEEADEMTEYLLVLHESPGDAAALPPERIPEIVGEYRAWAGELAQRGRLVTGQKLADEPGKLLSARGEQVAVADASWTGVDDIVTGFFQIRARSYADAVEISRTCPHIKYGKYIELRRIEPTD